MAGRSEATRIWRKRKGTSTYLDNKYRMDRRVSSKLRETVQSPEDIRHPRRDGGITGRGCGFGYVLCSHSHFI